MKVGITSFLASIIFLLSPFFVFAFSQTVNPNSGKNADVYLPKNQVVQGDYFAVGKTVTIDGTVKGDLYAAGGQVLVNGNVQGDVLVAGGKITVRGTVSQNVRVAGGQIAINGSVGRNITTLGGSVDINDSAKIGGSMVAAGGTISQFAPIGRGATIAGGKILINNTINGNVMTAGKNITLGSGAKVHGNLTVYSSSKPTMESGSSISGTTKFYKQGPKSGGQAKHAAKGVAFGFSLIDLLSSFILGVLLLKFFPRYMRNTTLTVREHFWRSLLIGIIAIIVTPILFIILLVTIIGIPLAFLLLFFFIVSLFFAKLFVAIVVGQLLLDVFKFYNVYAALFVGLVVYGIISLIPIIGGLVAVIVICVGIGVMLTEDRNLYLLLRDKNHI